MHHTTIQNTALYALQHRVSTQPWNKVPLERASAREKSLPPVGRKHCHSRQT